MQLLSEKCLCSSRASNFSHCSVFATLHDKKRKDSNGKSQTIAGRIIRSLPRSDYRSIREAKRVTSWTMQCRHTASKVARPIAYETLAIPGPAKLHFSRTVFTKCTPACRTILLLSIGASAAFQFTHILLFRSQLRSRVCRCVTTNSPDREFWYSCIHCNLRDIRSATRTYVT